MRYELATPLLLANLLRWVAPDVFRDVDVTTQSAGSVTMPLTNEKERVQVLRNREPACRSMCAAAPSSFLPANRPACASSPEIPNAFIR